MRWRGTLLSLLLPILLSACGSDGGPAGASMIIDSSMRPACCDAATFDGRAEPDLGCGPTDERVDLTDPRCGNAGEHAPCCNPGLSCAFQERVCLCGSDGQFHCGVEGVTVDLRAAFD